MVMIEITNIYTKAEKKNIMRKTKRERSKTSRTLLIEMFVICRSTTSLMESM